MSTPTVETSGLVFDIDAVQAVLDGDAAGDATGQTYAYDEVRDAVTGWGTSVLTVIDVAFTALSDGDDPVGLNCTEWAGLGLPARFLSLRDWMLARPTAYGARAAVWRELVARARRDPQWVTATVGMALPALVSAAGKIARGFDGDPCDIDGE